MSEDDLKPTSIPTVTTAGTLPVEARECGCYHDFVADSHFVEREDCRYPDALAELSSLRTRLELAEIERGELCEALPPLLRVLDGFSSLGFCSADRLLEIGYAHHLLSRIAESKGGE